MMKIILENNSGYSWFTNSDIYVKGYIYDKWNRLFANEDLLKYFSSSETSFEEKLKEANGLFAVVIRTGKEIKFAVDRTRTMPLFYSVQTNNFCVFDRNLISDESKLNDFAAKEFESSGFVTGNHTLLKDVFQVQAGELVEFSQEEIRTKFYFSYATQLPIGNMGPKEELSKVFERLIKRTINYAAGQKLIIPLSGGYDSRLLATLLKKHNYSNVLCFTYGRANSFEVATSKEVASTLNYDWVFIEYTDELIRGFSANDQFKDFFFNSGSNLCSLSHIQDFFAVQQLANRKLIDKNSIFLPGHTGDVLAGSHLENGWKRNNSKKYLLKAILKKHYALNDYNKISSELKAKINQNVQKGSPYYIVFEDWGLRERQAKYIINSVRVYEQFNCKYLLPLWDKELIEFFKFLPLEKKIDTVFYNNHIMKGIFKDFKVDIAKTNAPPVSKVLRKIIPSKLKRIIKGLLSNHADFNNFSAINEELGKSKSTYVLTVLTDYYLRTILRKFG